MECHSYVIDRASVNLRAQQSNSVLPAVVGQSCCSFKADAHSLDPEVAPAEDFRWSCDIPRSEDGTLDRCCAFELPPEDLSSQLIDSFFSLVAPLIPVINEPLFRSQYSDPMGTKSLLVLQAIFLAGSHVCTCPQLLDSSGSVARARKIFYQRAVALYDADYEKDRVHIIQALVLIGWSWENVEDGSKSAFHWYSVAIAIARDLDMHKREDYVLRSEANTQIRRRIWWTLFTRDRSLAFMFGHPIMIQAEDISVEMISEADFTEDAPNQPACCSTDATRGWLFINHVRLCDIKGAVVSTWFPVRSKVKSAGSFDVRHATVALAEWLQQLPSQLRYGRYCSRFWAAVLHLDYYSTLYWLHKAEQRTIASYQGSVSEKDQRQLSSDIASRAMDAMTEIIENLSFRDWIRYAPATIVHSLWLALSMYSSSIHDRDIGMEAVAKIQLCLNVLEGASNVWEAAKPMHTFFMRVTNGVEDTGAGQIISRNTNTIQRSARIPTESH